ncbi:MAG: aldo/keto reductase [Chloroflexi bacterium]|nr:aldo/keto reductase [Chloroflexota bacterium]
MKNGLTTTTLGRTGLEVTRLAFGAMEIRGAPRGREVTPGQADKILNAVLDSGINYIDTSVDYGQSEEFIGKFISHRRAEFFLASKCGCHVGAPAAPPGARSPHIFTPENIVAGVEQSLKRMKTDYLDVVQFHSSPSQKVLEENGSVGTLVKLKEQGKIRHIGMSNTLPELREHIKMGVFEVMQIPYSALERRHEDWISAAANAGVGTVIRGGVAKGEPGQSGVPRPDVWSRFESAGLDELVEDGENRTSFMLRFTLSHPKMHTTIVGTLNPTHLASNVSAASKGPLPDDVYAEAKRRLTSAGEVPANAG